MSWKLWIDDQCGDPETPTRHPPDGFVPARSSSQAIEITLYRGVPSFISFDHDFGADDNAMVYIDWLIDHFYDMTVPEYTIHSANPVGRENIISKMESWKKSQSL